MSILERGTSGLVLLGNAAPATRRAVLRLLNSRLWSGRVLRWAVLSKARTAPLDVVIAIPACDESARIKACLDACAHSATLSGLRVRLVVLVNGTGDDTAERVLSWSVGRRCPITLFDVDFVDAFAHAGAARRLALELAALETTSDTILLTTDADARPEPGWVRANVAHVRAGASLVCGRVALDPEEAAHLPAAVKSVGEIEGRYKRATLELQHLLDPDPWNPWPHHGAASGASLAIRAADLAAVGGVPLIPSGEDKALARLVRAHGLRVVHAGDVEIEVSCRLRGRAANGMADALRERAHDADPLCDEALEPAFRLRDRLLARTGTRRLWVAPAARLVVLLALGADRALATALAAVDEFERAWDEFERAVLDLTRTRLRVSDLHRELPMLLDLVRAARRGDFDADRLLGAPRGRVDPIVEEISAVTLSKAIQFIHLPLSPSDTTIEINSP